MPLHIDYRPKNFDEVMGNESTIKGLQSVLSREDKPHAFMFTGPKGCGKTTLARIVGGMVGCTKDGLNEYNTANTRGIDTIREIDQNCRYAPLSGGSVMYLMDECHKLTNDAQNALLKLLEEPPRHVFFALCTTNPEKVLDTVKDRCQMYKVKLLSTMQIKKLLRGVLKAENVKDFPMEAVSEIARVSEGTPRRALVVLDGVIDIEDSDELMEAISDALISEQEVRDLCRLLISPLQVNKWKQVAELLKGVTEEPEQVRYAILGYLNTAILNSNGDAAERIRLLIDCFEDSYIYKGKVGLSGSCYDASRL
jgi:DNA polymerase III gamma/tau subunit